MSGQRNKDSLEYQLTRGAPLALILVAIAYILYRLVLIIEIVAVAALLALVLRTSLHWIKNIVKLRWLAVVILIGLILGFVAFVALVLLPNFIFETQILLQQLPDYVDSFRNFATKIHDRWRFIPDVTLGLNQLRGYLGRILTSLPLLLSNTFGGAVEVIGTVILALYMSYDPNSVIRGILRLIPRRHHNQFYRVLDVAGVRLRGWIFGTGVAMLFLGVGAGVGLYFIGVPLPITFAVFAGFLEIIPYVGSILGTILPAIVALTVPNGLTKALLVVGLFLILNQVDAHLIQPLVMGKQVDVNPVLVVIAFLVMGELFGFIGILVAVPAAAVFVTLIEEFTPKPPPQEEQPPQLDHFNS